MKRASTRFLQAVIVLLGVVAVVIMIRFPMTEGRAENLDLISIYLDPFILYGYAASIAFFVALYKAFQILGYIRNNNVFSQESIRALRTIRNCAILLSVLIVIAGLYIRLFHDKDDDPAGFLAFCIGTAFVSVVVAAAASIFESIVQSGIAMTAENE